MARAPAATVARRPPLAHLRCALRSHAQSGSVFYTQSLGGARAARGYGRTHRSLTHRRVGAPHRARPSVAGAHRSTRPGLPGRVAPGRQAGTSSRRDKLAPLRDVCCCGWCTCHMSHEHASMPIRIYVMHRHARLAAVTCVHRDRQEPRHIGLRLWCWPPIRGKVNS
jgi:hypothetical protein